MCRMTLIFFERKDMMLDNLLNMLNMVMRRVENFLGAFEKTFTRKTCIFEAYVNPYLRVWISQKSKVFYVSCHIIRMTCRMTLILFRAYRYDVGECFRYPEHGRRTSGKFSTAT